MRTILSLLGRHWLTVLGLVVLIAGSVAYAASPQVRVRADSTWHSVLAWAGLGDESAGSDRVFWCPMHPQIKSSKENAVCPICNMALVELEGGVVEAPEHLTLTAQQVQQAGVATEPVILRQLYREVDTTGRLDYDERRYKGISSWVTGKSRIDKLQGFTGEQVQQGKLVAEIYSPQLISAQEEFLINQQDSARGRERTSLTDGLGLGSDAYLSDSRQKLLNQGMTAEQIDQLAERGTILERIPVHAPISGTIIKRYVQEGQYVNEGDWLFHLADLSRLWLFVDIYEDERPLVEVGTSVDLTVSDRSGETFAGTVAFIEPKVRPETRTIPVRIDIDNEDGKLLPGMFARALIRRDFPAVLAVPENAVLSSGQRRVVIVRSGEGTFEPREVQMGTRWLYSSSSDTTNGSDLGFGEDRVRYHEVLAGLNAGEQVVTSGAFLLNAESQFQSVLTKMLPPRDQRATLEQIVGVDSAKALREMLDAYFQLSQALAGDRLEEVPLRMGTVRRHAAGLAEVASQSGSKTLADDAGRFSNLLSELTATDVTDPADARTRFGRISHELTKLLTAHGGQTLFGEELYQFECGMSGVGYERWLWWSPEIHNPYMGRKMLKCGTKLDVLEP